MRDHLGAFEDEIREFVERRQSVIDQAILLWRLVYHVVLGYRDRHPEWIFARHGDLSSNPMAEFPRIYERLHLPYGAREEINTRHFCMAEAKEAVKESPAAPRPLVFFRYIGRYLRSNSGLVPTRPTRA